jgi:ribosomal protein S7
MKFDLSKFTVQRFTVYVAIFALVATTIIFLSPSLLGVKEGGAAKTEQINQALKLGKTELNSVSDAKQKIWTDLMEKHQLLINAIIRFENAATQENGKISGLPVVRAREIREAALREIWGSVSASEKNRVRVELMKFYNNKPVQADLHESVRRVLGMGRQELAWDLKSWAPAKPASSSGSSSSRLGLSRNLVSKPSAAVKKIMPTSPAHVKKKAVPQDPVKTLANESIFAFPGRSPSKDIVNGWMTQLYDFSTVPDFSSLRSFSWFRASVYNWLKSNEGKEYRKKLWILSGHGSHVKRAHHFLSQRILIFPWGRSELIDFSQRGVVQTAQSVERLSFEDLGVQPSKIKSFLGIGNAGAERETKLNQVLLTNAAYNLLAVSFFSIKEQRAINRLFYFSKALEKARKNLCTGGSTCKSSVASYVKKTLTAKSGKQRRANLRWLVEGANKNESERLKELKQLLSSYEKEGVFAAYEKLNRKNWFGLGNSSSLWKSVTEKELRITSEEAKGTLQRYN